MRIVQASEEALEDVTHEETVNCRIQWMIASKDGAPNFAMRRFVLGPRGSTPRHRHPWEHEVYVLAGRVVMYVEGEEHELGPGMAVLVAPGEEHRFYTQEEGVEFLCLVPNGPATEGH
jgi:quercetin dioxygenase-like cupin family protein